MKKDMSAVFTIQEVVEDQVVIEVNAKNALTVARFPFLNSEMAYITVTRGEDHVFTVINEDGKTWSFDFGSSGYTLISDSTKRLKNAVLDFIKEKNIAIDYAGGEPVKATVYYNSFHKKWQLSVDTVKGHFNQWSDTARNFEEALEAFKGFVTSVNWRERIAPTGITVWDAVNPVFSLL